MREYIKIIGNTVNPDIKLRIGDIPYPDGKGKNICADISGLTEDTGWRPEISFEEGIGYGYKNYFRRAIIIEAKKSKKESDMDKDCDKAIEQIKVKVLHFK